MALLVSFRQWSEQEAWISALRDFGTTNQFQDINLLLVFTAFCKHSTSQTSFLLRNFSSTLLCHRKILIPAFFWFPHQALQHFLTLCCSFDHWEKHLPFLDKHVTVFQDKLAVQGLWRWKLLGQNRELCMLALCKISQFRGLIKQDSEPRQPELVPCLIFHHRDVITS